MEIISSRQNPNIKLAHGLRTRKQRQAQGLFLVEGLHHIGSAFESEAVIEKVIYSKDLLKGEYSGQLIEKLSAANNQLIPTTPEIIEYLSDRDSPQGILLIAKSNTLSIDDINPETFSFGVAVDKPQDPGNLGSILRTLDAVGGDGLIILNGGVDVYHPASVRASMGGIFWKSIIQTSFDTFKYWAEQFGYHVYGSSAKGSKPFFEVSSYDSPTVLLLGSEREGLNEQQIKLCQELVSIPQKGHVTSLNLAAAAAILLYDMDHKRNN